MLKGFYKHGFDCVGGLPAQPKKGVMAELRRKLNRGPGADGAAVALAGKRERRRAKAAFANWGFNLVASHKVSLHRAVPDHRDPACAKRDFAAEVGVNVSASVVVVFHNEAWQAAFTKLCTTVINVKIFWAGPPCFGPCGACCTRRQDSSSTRWSWWTTPATALTCARSWTSTSGSTSRPR